MIRDLKRTVVKETFNDIRKVRKRCSIAALENRGRGL